MNRTPFRFVKLLFDSDVYTVIAILSVCLATLGVISLKKRSPKKNVRFTNMAAAFN